jgi:hypothetical protein
MGSRTNFGIATYRHDDLSNIVIIMPSMSQKYFYPQNVKDAIIDNVKIDIQKVLEDVSDWEGDSWTHTAQEYMPTIILLQGSGSYRGSFVVNYLKNEDSDIIYYRVFSFEKYKEINLVNVDKVIQFECENEVTTEQHTKEEEMLINRLLHY